jgi:oleate hydratase
MSKIDQPHRDPDHIQAWLIGGGIGSLSAAVHLIGEAQVPGSNIHLVDLHPNLGGGMTPGGNAQDGYFLPFECHPHFHGSSLVNLLSLVPSKTEFRGTMMDEIRRFENIERPQPQTSALARALKRGSSGPELVETKSLHIGPKNRIALVKLMLELETTIGAKTIEDIMDESFFRTTFWMLWATEYALPNTAAQV